MSFFSFMIAGLPRPGEICLFCPPSRRPWLGVSDLRYIFNTGENFQVFRHVIFGRLYRFGNLILTYRFQRSSVRIEIKIQSVLFIRFRINYTAPKNHVVLYSVLLVWSFFRNAHVRQRLFSRTKNIKCINRSIVSNKHIKNCFFNRLQYLFVFFPDKKTILNFILFFFLYIDSFFSYKEKYIILRRSYKTNYVLLYKRMRPTTTSTLIYAVDQSRSKRSNSHG